MKCYHLKRLNTLPAAFRKGHRTFIDFKEKIVWKLSGEVLHGVNLSKLLLAVWSHHSSINTSRLHPHLALKRDLNFFQSPWLDWTSSYGIQLFRCQKNLLIYFEKAYVFSKDISWIIVLWKVLFCCFLQYLANQQQSSQLQSLIILDINHYESIELSNWSLLWSNLC